MSTVLQWVMLIVNQKFYEPYLEEHFVSVKPRLQTLQHGSQHMLKVISHFLNYQSDVNDGPNEFAFTLLWKELRRVLHHHAFRKLGRGGMLPGPLMSRVGFGVYREMYACERPACSVMYNTEW